MAPQMRLSLAVLFCVVAVACSDEPADTALSDTSGASTEGSETPPDDATDASPVPDEPTEVERADEASDEQTPEGGDSPAPTDPEEPTPTDPEEPTSTEPDENTWPEPTYGLSTQSLVHDGVTREYLLFVPQSYTGAEAVPVLINFHGGSMNAQGQLYVSDMRSLSESEGFILVYPEGSQLASGEQHWNPIPSSADSKSDTDDFGFVAAMLDTIAEGHNMDDERVYVTGYSNGAGMAYGLACYLSDRIAAAAPVSGSMYDTMAAECNATHPTAVAVFNGTQDTERPYDGLDGWFMPVEDAVDFWVAQNGITEDPTIETFQTGGVSVERRTYAPVGGSAVVLFKVIGGGHDWFGFDIAGANIDQTIWTFFNAHDQNGLR